MQKTKLFSVIMILCMICSFVACTDHTAGQQEQNANSAIIQETSGVEMAQYLNDNLQLEDVMSSFDMDIAVSLFNLTANEVVLEESMVICSTGATAEEIAVFTTREEATDIVVEACKNRVEAQKLGFENYVPEELEKLETPVIVREGNKVIFVVCNDAQNAEELIRNYGL